MDLSRYSNVADLLDDGVENGSDLRGTPRKASIGCTDDENRVTEALIKAEKASRLGGLAHWNGIYYFGQPDEAVNNKFSKPKTRAAHGFFSIVLILVLWVPSVVLFCAMVPGADLAGVVLLVLELLIASALAFRIPYLLIKRRTSGTRQ